MLRRAITLAVCVLMCGCAGSSPSATGPADAATSPASLAPQPTTTPPLPLAGRVIVIDPGHNGGNAAHPEIINALVPAGNGRTKACDTTGTATNATAAVAEYPEHAHNWDVANRLSSLLTALGARVVLTRSSDAGVGPCVNVRAQIGNDAQADVVISVHADGNESLSARGFHVIYSTTMVGGSAIETRSRLLAEVVRDAFAAQTGMPRSTYIGSGTALSPRDDLAGLNLSTRVRVLVEAGNMMNVTDAALLTSADFRQREAEALAAAVRTFLS